MRETAPRGSVLPGTPQRWFWGASTEFWGSRGVFLPAEAASDPGTGHMGWLCHRQLSDSDPGKFQHRRGHSKFQQGVEARGGGHTQGVPLGAEPFQPLCVLTAVPRISVWFAFIPPGIALFPCLSSPSPMTSGSGWFPGTDLLGHPATSTAGTRALPHGEDRQTDRQSVLPAAHATPRQRPPQGHTGCERTKIPPRPISSREWLRAGPAPPRDG